MIILRVYRICCLVFANECLRRHVSGDGDDAGGDGDGEIFS